MNEPKGYYTRGYLPHVDTDGVAQFVTWRLADSLPARLLEQWGTELALLPESERKSELRRLVEAHLDSGAGSCLLSHPVAADCVQRSLLYHHRRRVHLHAWVVMPNHVHVLCTPLEGQPLYRAVQAWKSFTSRAIHGRLGGSGQLWYRDYFDRAIRDADHFRKVVAYIEQNPVNAGLCAGPRDWPFSSAASGVPR